MMLAERMSRPALSKHVIDIITCEKKSLIICQRWSFFIVFFVSSICKSQDKQDGGKKRIYMRKHTLARFQIYSAAMINCECNIINKYWDNIYDCKIAYYRNIVWNIAILHWHIKKKITDTRLYIQYMYVNFKA